MPHSESSEEPSPTPAAFHVLLALAVGERHGYAIMREAEAIGFRMGPGTLYGTIKRLLEQGAIEEVTAPPQPDDDGRRRYYRITDAGGHVLRAETSRLARLVERATARGVIGCPAGEAPR